MKKIRYKCISILSLTLLGGLFLSSGAIVGNAARARDNEIITTRSAFINALNDAQDGDTLLVGDIDFNLPSTGAVNISERIVIDKDIVVKNGKTDGNAVFTGASFILEGTKQAGEETAFLFDGITFDETLDTSALTSEDWLLTYDGMGEPVSDYPVKNQYAIECKGNASASFTECEFKNYMHTYGPAIRAFYADYTLIPSVEYEHGDNVPYKLNVTLDGCSFLSNASLYGGGAIHIEGNHKNVTLIANNCIFDSNKSAYTYNGVGGGAVYMKDTEATFTGCSFEENDANYYYGGDRSFKDQTIGGGIACSTQSELTVRDCSFVENKASNGGAISATESIVDIEDCHIMDNEAIPSAEDTLSSEGLGAQQGLGGAIYLNGNTKVTIGNTEILRNYAENVFGAIYAYYNPLNDFSENKIELLFCSVADNVCGTEVSEYMGYDEPDRWLWFTLPGDFFDISYLEYYGNIIVDSVYETYLSRSESPTEENGYNFFGSVAPQEWYEDGHLVHGSAIPTDFVKEKLGDRNYYGTFTVGANNHDVTYRFFADGVCQETVTLHSGVVPTMPAFEKTGHSLTGWTLAEEMDYEEGRAFVVGNETESVDVHAIFTPNVYKVTFDFGESNIEVEQTYGTALTLPQTAERYGYTFKGWFVSEDGAGEAIENGAVFTHAGDIVYYAVYEKEFPLFTVIITVSVGLLVVAMSALAFITWKRRHQSVPAFVEGEVAPPQKEQPDTSMLSPREKEVLQLLLDGKQRSEIAKILYISENTVKKQITSLYAKLGVTTRNELFALFK